MNTNTMYATRKRRKPIQKRAKPPAEGAKSNPSKRHRERLNGELERLANLLPFSQDVISKLDKLTVLRLSVSYLRAKSFFNVTPKSDSCPKPDSNGQKQGEANFLEGELLLQVLNGFVLVASSDGVVFYVSSTIQEYLGFHQSDIIHQNVYDLIHTEDRPEFRRQLHWALDPTLSPETGQESSDGRSAQLPLACYRPEQLPPENSTFLDRNFVCRVRCLLDNSSGFLTMNFQGRLKFLHAQNQRMKDGLLAPPPLALFAIASPLQPPSILEIRTKSFMFRTKHKLDFTPTACDAKGKTVLGYTEAELCYRGTGYQFIHAADMLHCAENHIRMMKTGESGMTVFRLLTKQSGWVWVQANARLIYKNGKPECIIASQRVITDEEGEENLSKRNLKLPFGFTTGEAVLYDTNGLLMEGDSSQSNGTRSLDPNSLLGAMLKQDESAYVCVPAQSPVSFQHSALADSGEDQILSGDWQDDILSLSENGIFKQKPINGSEEDKNGDLLNFMKGLGISREDLKLIQKDEEFLQIRLDEQGDIMDVADEILSYVQESLKTSDCIFSNSTERKLSGQHSSCAPQSQQPHLVPHLQHEQPLLQPQQEKPVLQQHLHTQMHPQQTFPQQYLHTQAHPHQPISQQHPHAQTEQLISQQHPQTQQLISQQNPHAQTGQLISQQHPQTQQLISQKHPRTQQLSSQQHPQTQQLISQQNPHAQTGKLISQQHSQTQQLISQQHPQTQQLISQQHPQTQQLFSQQHSQTQQLISQQHPQTQQLISQQHPQTQQIISQQHPQTQQLISQQHPQTQQIISQQHPQTQQLISQQHPQTQQLISQQHAQTQQLISQQHTQTQQIISQQHPQTQQLISQQHTHPQTQQLISQQHTHPQTQQLILPQHPHMQEIIPQKHSHGETQQLVLQQHLHIHGYTHQPIPQQNLHMQTPPWQPIPQQHTLVQQQIPQQQIMQQHPPTQTYKQQTAPQQHLQARMHSQRQSLGQEQPLVLQKQLQEQLQQHLDLQQQSSHDLAQPQLSHKHQELPLKQLPQQQEHLLRSSLPEQQQQLCHKMKHMQVNGKCPSLKQPVAMPTTNGHPLPPPFCADWSLSQYGCLVQEASTLDPPYQKQLNAMSIACDQAFSPYTEGLAARGAGSFTPQNLEDLLEGLQPRATGERHCATILQDGNTTPLCHPTALPVNQGLPETCGLGREQQVNPKLLTPCALGHQPFLSHFQNGSGGVVTQTQPESIGGMGLPQPGRPLHRNPDESRPFQDLTMGGVM